MSKTILVDINNLLMIVRHAELPKEKKEQYGKELLLSRTINFTCDLVSKYNGDKVIVAFEGGNNWRYNVLQEYKAHRDREVDIYRNEIIETLNTLFEFFDEYTNFHAIKCDESEADDVIAIAVQENPEQEFVILSADKDFLPLISDKVTLYSPAQKKEREIDGDPEFVSFMKAIRGDTSDNIRSAFPRVRETKLRKAWEDDYEMKNLMETKRKEDDRTVGEVYQINKKLTDLTQQPDYIRDRIKSALNRPPHLGYNQMKTLRYLRDQNIAEYLEDNYSRIAKVLRIH